MTSEERFDRIEQVLQRTAELQSQHAEQFRQYDAQIGRQNEGIKSLIVVARTVLDSIHEVRERHEKDYEELRRAQAATDEKLNILINTVDRIIRHRENGK